MLKYDQEAIELARKLYIQYGGKHHHLIEQEMRKAGYSGWAKINLLNKGKLDGPHFAMGWIERYGFDRSLQEYLKTQIVAVTEDVDQLYSAIKAVREAQQAKLAGGHGTRDDLQIFRDFCKLEMEARQKLQPQTDNYETFVLCWEKILGWLTELAPTAAAALLAGDTAEKLLGRAIVEYADSEKQQAENLA